MTVQFFLSQVLFSDQKSDSGPMKRPPSKSVGDASTVLAKESAFSYQQALLRKTALKQAKPQGFQANCGFALLRMSTRAPAPDLYFSQIFGGRKWSYATETPAVP